LIIGNKFKFQDIGDKKMHLERNAYWGQLIMVSLLLTLLTQTVIAQNTASIVGLIKDQNEAVVPGAAIVATNKGSGRVSTTVSDSNGKYEFKNLSSGQYRVQVKKSGFSEIGASVSIDSAENIVQDFSISLGGLREEVTVTAAKGLRATSDIPQTVTTVGEDEINERRPVGISEAFEKSPSVLSTDPNPFRARPQIRGLQSNRILVTVDGERLNNPRFGADNVGVSPSLVDTSQIKSVEVVAGSGSSLYGSDAIGGAINIITKGPDRSKDGIRVDFKVNGDYGSNKNFRKGTFNFGVGSKLAAVRLNFGRFIQPNYHVGGQGISRQEVITAGIFADRAGNLAQQPLVGSYPVYELSPNQEIGNSGARGYLGAVDFMVFPDETQDFRIRFNANPYRDLGAPFTTIPFSTSTPNTGYSKFVKLSLRYEKREIANWFPRVSGSYYYSDYRRSLEETRHAIRNGSSFTTVNGPAGPVNSFNGGLSTFAKSGESFTTNNNTGKGFDVQFNFIPWKNAIYITGVNYSNDFSRDTFANKSFSTATGLQTGSVSDQANTPRTHYKNLGWYNQLEYTPNKYLRLSGGLRWDDWRTEAEPTSGFPNGAIGAVFLRTLPLIQANPGSLDPVGAAGYATLAGGTAVRTKSNVATYNVGATFFIPGGVNPYIRYSTSFREPDILNRYLFRNFTTAPFFSLPSIINTNLVPERGRDVDVGIKLNRSKVRGTFSYYRNVISDATNTAQGVYCVNITTPTPIPGVVNTPPGFGCPNPPAAPTHLVQVFQTVNVNKVTIRGFEASAEADFQLGDLGSFTPYFTFSTIKSQQTPDANRRAIVQTLYNSSAPLELEGTVDDVPFYSLPNYQGSFSPRFTSAKGNWWTEYEYRFTSKVTRVEPNDISFAGITTYGYFAAYKGIKKHAIRGGFKFSETMPTTVTFGVENLTNRTYFQLFQPAPGAGRSFTFGVSFGLSKIVK
jgi:outer membrane receptor protein involved in Fe transport